jgi:prevent-host-death family protein
VNDFKAHVVEWLTRIARTGRPLVITQNGKAAGVLLSPAQFDELSARAHFVGAIDEGLADSGAGRVHSHAAVVAEIRKRRGARVARQTRVATRRVVRRVPCKLVWTDRAQCSRRNRRRVSLRAS